MYGCCDVDPLPDRILYFFFFLSIYNACFIIAYTAGNRRRLPDSPYRLSREVWVVTLIGTLIAAIWDLDLI